MRAFLAILVLGGLSACHDPGRPSTPLYPSPTPVPIPYPSAVPAFAEPTPLPGTAPDVTPVVAAVVVPAPTVTEAVVLPAPTATVAPKEQPLFAGPEPRALTEAGLNLIIEFEVGGLEGYNPHPEAPDARLSGVTWGIGYDGHQNKPAIIKQDWQALGEQNAQRLAETHPYVGRDAQAHLSQVRDILVVWQIAADVFDRIDVAREFSRARRAYGPDFDSLRPNCQAALISCGFNRGYSFTGANRSEMRAIRDLVPKRDYEAMAAQMRASERVWRGTEIYRGMLRRRIAEAKLIVTP